MHLGQHIRSDAIQITDPLPNGFAFNDINFFFLKEKSKTKQKTHLKKTPPLKTPNPALVRKSFKEFSREYLKLSGLF